MNKRTKKLLKRLKRLDRPIFILSDGIRYPCNKKATAQMQAERLPASTVTREALKILHKNFAVRGPIFRTTPNGFGVSIDEIPPKDFYKEGAD